MPDKFRRRTVLQTIAAAIGGSALGGSAVRPVAGATSAVGSCDTDVVEDLAFNETSSLLDENYDRLTDDDVVFVFSEDSADAGQYSDEAVPLWARDGNYFGSGSLLVTDVNVNDNDFTYGQEEVLLNIIDAYAGGSGHVVYDESAGQASNYSLSEHFSSFADWVGDNDYTIEASTDLTVDLDGADALLVTLPNEEHDADQIDAIRDFAAGGNPVFLFNEADSWDTDDLNHLAEELGLAFRFAEDEVTDEPGWEWDDWPITGNYDDETYPEWFENREGMGFEPGQEYTAEIDEVVDGDSFDVVHRGGYYDGVDDTIRHLGIDTAETGGTDNNSDEWYGIEDEKHLDEWGKNATDYAENNFSSGDEITFYVDGNESGRGTYGRLLAYHNYPEDSGDSDVQYNLDMVDLGYAKPYNSGFEQHSEFNEAYWDARAAGDRIWSESDPEATGEVNNEDVTTLRFRDARRVTTTDGALEDSHTAVWSGDDDPLVGVDEANGVALVAGLVNSDNWADANDENFVFSANLAQELADVSNTEERYLVEGGHNQFAASYDFSYEGKETFLRFLEGLDAMELSAVNDIDSTYVSTDRAHTIVIPPPATDTCYTTDEIDQLKQFRDDGGSIVLKADTAVDPESVDVLNGLAAELDTDLRFDDVALGNVETSNFNTADFDLWSAYDTDGSSDGGDDTTDPASFSVTIDDYDGEVTEGEDVDVAYTIENTGDEEDTQDVVFNVDGTQEDVEPDVTLGSGETFSDTFTYTTEEGDSPEITVEVATEDNAEQRDVTVNEDDGGDGEHDVLDADPNTQETESYHTWTLADPSDDFAGEVDTITVEYPSGTSMDGLTDEDVQVYVDRDGDGTVDEIRVNADEYAGSTATFDLDGRYDTTVEGEVRVEIDGVVNPEEGDYVATITLDGDDTHSVDAEYVVESDSTGDSAPTIDRFDVTDDGNNAWNRYDVDWAVSDDDADLVDVTSEMLDSADTVLDAESSDVSGSDASGSHTLESKDSASELRLTVTDETGNETVDTKPV